jgi:hypothetical protein
MHLDVGPIRVVYDWNLITYTTYAHPAPQWSLPLPPPATNGCANIYPSPIPCIPNGWSANPFPTMTPIVFFVRLSNIGGSDIMLLPNSALEMEVLSNNAGTAVASNTFYIIKPMPLTGCWDTYFRHSWYNASYDPSGSCPAPSGASKVDVHPYNPSMSGQFCLVNNPCYVLKGSGTFGVAGQNETYVSFSASSPSASDPQVANSFPNAMAAFPMSFSNVLVFLVLYYQYQGYQYGVTIPLMTIRTGGP